MRAPDSSLIYADFCIQMIFQGIIIFCAFVGFVNESAILISFILLFPLGIWQVISSLYTNFFLRMKSRRLHLLLIMFYFFICFSTYIYLKTHNPRMDPFNLILLGLILAEIIAIYYSRITYLDYKIYLNQKEVVSVKKELDADILDADIF